MPRIPHHANWSKDFDGSFPDVELPPSEASIAYTMLRILDYVRSGLVERVVDPFLRLDEIANDGWFNRSDEYFDKMFRTLSPDADLSLERICSSRKIRRAGFTDDDILIWVLTGLTCFVSGMIASAICVLTCKIKCGCNSESSASVTGDDANNNDIEMDSMRCQSEAANQSETGNLETNAGAEASGGSLDADNENLPTPPDTPRNFPGCECHFDHRRLDREISAAFYHAVAQHDSILWPESSFRRIRNLCLALQRVTEEYTSSYTTLSHFADEVNHIARTLEGLAARLDILWSGLEARRQCGARNVRDIYAATFDTAMQRVMTSESITENAINLTFKFYEITRRIFNLNFHFHLFRPLPRVRRRRHAPGPILCRNLG